jgi:hypothetical protein
LSRGVAAAGDCEKRGRDAESAGHHVREELRAVGRPASKPVPVDVPKVRAAHGRDDLRESTRAARFR